MKKIIPIISLIAFLLLEEVIFTITTTNTVGNIILKSIFTILICFFILTITNIFNKKTNKRLFYIFTAIITLIYIIYDIYYKVLGNILSITSLINGTQETVAFSTVIINKIINNWYIIVLLVLPYILLIALNKKLIFEKANIKTVLIFFIITILAYISSIAYIKVTSKKEDIYSPNNLYYSINNPIENFKNFGLLTTIRLDIERAISGFKEKDLYAYENEQGQSKVINVDEYNITDINFDQLISQETNKEIQDTYEYLKKQEPSNKNKYTGKLKGKNLIVIVAESFSRIAIKENLTPTLYKMANESYKFNNFYTPLFPVSTADGEYLVDNSLLPVEGIWSIEHVNGKTFPYTYAKVLKSNNYKTYAYHDYKYDYYKRDKYFETMGYETYLGQGNGLEKRMDFSQCPASDYEMIKTTVDDYINEKNFLAYYMTISGHMEYDKRNAIVRKNWDQVKELPYSEKSKAYLATQIELDKALEELINRLKEAGRLEDTVIILMGDHYPYGLSLQEIEELSNEDIDMEFGRYHMPFILYDAEQTNTIEVDKYACSLDVLPTMLNLFGIKYDSRLLMGRDIFSDSEPLVIFSDRSYITEKGRYNSMTEHFEKNDEQENIDKEYIDKIKEKIYHKYKYSRLILENDIYKRIFNTK